MASAIAFLAGLGSGYLDEKDKDAERARRDKFDRIALDEADARRADRTRANADRDELRAASAPVAVTTEAGVMPASMDERDIGQPGEAPIAPTYRVGARTFASEGAASKAATDDQRKNIASALARQDPLKAERYRADTAQGDAAQMSMEQAVAKAKKEGFGDALSAALAGQTPAQVEAAFNARGETKISGLKIEPFETTHPVLGKRASARITGVGADGKPFEVPDALAASFGLFNAEKQADLAMKAKDDTRLDKTTDATIEHQKGMLAVSQQQANTQEGYRKDQAANMREQRRLQASHDAAVAAGKAQAGAPIQLSLKDMKDFDDDVNKRVTEIFSPKDGMSPEERGALGTQRNAAVSQANGIFHANATKGNPMTAGTVLQAMELARDPKNVQQMKGSDGMVYKTVAVNGQPVIVSAPLVPKPAAPQAAPGAAPARANPAAIAAQGGVSQAPADPMARQMAVESSELNRGARTDFSPEVKAYRQSANASQAQASAAANAAALERERVAALARSRAQLGR